MARARKHKYNQAAMTQATQQVFRSALRLKPVERAQLVDELFNSFDQRRTKAIDAVWADEAEVRLSAYRAGKLKADTLEAVLARINKR
jgi:putative addiction module component (TIGR02574 family)